jgi:hypothetical protein
LRWTAAASSACASSASLAVLEASVINGAAGLGQRRAGGHEPGSERCELDIEVAGVVVHGF